MLCGSTPIICDLNYQEYVGDAQVDGQAKKRGLVPRDYAKHPVGSYRSAPAWGVDMPLIPRAEWSERLRDMTANKARLSDIRMRGNNGKPIPALDQNGQGFCWFYSGTGCNMLLRAKANQPYVHLSAHAGACIIKQFRDEGGWGAQGLDFLMERGVPSVEFWPEKSMSRANDKPETWANAALHKITEGFIDLNAAQYDRNLTFDQVITCLLCCTPVIGDFNWWGHSVCLMDAVDGSQERQNTRMANGKLASLSEFEAIWGINDPVTAGFGVRDLNSWTDGWGELGTSVIAGGKAVPDGATAPRSTTPSLT